MNKNEKKRLEELEEIEKKYKTRNKYINDWQKEKYHRLTVLIPKDQKDFIAETAKNKGFKTVSDYIKNLIEKDLNAGGDDSSASDQENFPSFSGFSDDGGGLPFG